MKIRIKYCVRSLIFSFFNKMSSLIRESEKYLLIKSLKACGENCSFYMPIYIAGPENVELGDKVSIAPFVHIWGHGGLNIGNRVMIGSNSVITTLTHDYNQDVMFGTLIKKRIVIEDDVWIGAHSTILPGITVGKGAVVGAGSVVTKDVAPYSIVVGVPARCFKFRNARIADR